MPNDNDKIKSIYTTLKDGGADVGTEKEFNDWFLASGKDGYENRKSVYDALMDGGADAGRNYEEFRDWLGLHAVDKGSKSVRKGAAGVEDLGAGIGVRAVGGLLNGSAGADNSENSVRTGTKGRGVQGVKTGARPAQGTATTPGESSLRTLERTSQAGAIKSETVNHGDYGEKEAHRVKTAVAEISKQPESQKEDKPGFFAKMASSLYNALGKGSIPGPEGKVMAVGDALAAHSDQEVGDGVKPTTRNTNKTDSAQRLAQSHQTPEQKNTEVLQPSDWRQQPITVGYLTKQQRQTTQGAVYDQMYKEFENYYDKLKPGDMQPSAIRYLTDRAWDYNIDEGESGGVVVTPHGNHEGNGTSTDLAYVQGKDGRNLEVTLGNGRTTDLVNNVFNNFLTNKAQSAAEELAEKIPFTDPDSALDALRGNYYQSGYQKELWNIASKSGVPYEQFVTGYVKPALDAAIKRKYPGLDLHVGSLFSDWNKAAQAGKEYDPDALNDDERRLYDALMADFDQQLSADRATAKQKANELSGRETASNLAIGGRVGHGMQLGVPMRAQREYNAYADPSKAINYVLDKLYSNGNGGGQGGVPVKDNIDRQRVGNLLYRKIMDKLVQERIPKSKWGYVLKGFMDGDLGELFKNYTQTDFERHLDDLADTKYLQSLKGFSGMLASGGHEATKFLSDAWEYYLGGKVGSAVTSAVRKRAIKRFAGDLVERGIQRNVAEDIAARAFQRTAQNAGRKAVLGGLHGAGTMGTAQAISGSLRQAVSPIAGAKMDEILQRKANGEQISKQEEEQEIAEANKEAHSITSVVGAGAKGGLSGAVAGMSFGPGTYAGETVTKWASKYMGDLASAATGYTARLGTNAASATALGQAEGVITGEKPEDSIANQFAQNLVTFAMLDAQGAAPRLLIGHPIRTFREWKEYERSYGISKEDQQRMRDAGYGDMIDTIDGLVSERFRDRGSNTLPNNGWKPQEEATRINEGMMKMLADNTIPEELKRKYYSLVTGDNSKRLSPVVASEVTKDEDGNHYLVTYNKNGNVVSDRRYHSEKAAQEAQMKIGHEQDENLTDALQQGVFAKDADLSMEHAYHAAVEAFKNGDGSLGKGQQTLLYLYQNKERLRKALAAAGTGEPLSAPDQRLVSLFNTVQKQLFEHDANSHDGNIYKIAREAEAANGLAAHGLYGARKGHTEKEAKKLAEENGDEAVYVGGDVWRTASEDAAVKDYQKRLYDYLSGIEEGQGAEVKEPGRIEGKTGGDAAAEQRPTEPPTDPANPPTDYHEPPTNNGTPGEVHHVPGSEQPGNMGTGNIQVSDDKDTEDIQGNIQADGDTSTQSSEDQQQSSQGASILSQHVEKGYHQGASIEEDESQLAMIGQQADMANERFSQAFSGSQLGNFATAIQKAIEDDDESSMQKLLDQYDGQLSDEQKEATYNLIESRYAQKGIDDSILDQTRQYQEQRQKQLESISDRSGNITEMTLRDGSIVYYKSGDLSNEYGGVVVTDADGNPRQIPVSSITGVKEPVRAQQQLDNDTNAFADDLRSDYEGLANGSAMMPGQQTYIKISGKTIHVTCDRKQEDGTYQFHADDGSTFVLSPDEMQQRVQAARDESVQSELAKQKQQRTAREQEERLQKGIVGYAEGTPDLSHKNTDANIAGQYLRQQDQVAGRKSSETLQSLQDQQDTLKVQERQARFDLDREQQWLDVNGDDYTPEDKAKKEQFIADSQKEIADLRQRQRKLGAVRNAYMTPEERQKFRSVRLRTSEKARKAAEKTKQPLQPTATKVEGIGSADLLGNYPSQTDAEDFLNGKREEIIKQYRNGAKHTISDVQSQLRDYYDGLLELDDDELQALHSRLLDAKQAEQQAMEQIRQIKGAQQRLPITYKDRNKEDLDKMEPAERRAAILSKANGYEDLLTKAKEAYKDSPNVGRLSELEPESLEEYVAQHLGYGTFNWEGKGTGASRKNGLQQELGLSRGIGRGFDSNGINAYLAPKGQGKSVGEIAHELWETAEGTPFERYDTEDMRNAILDLFMSYPNARAIRELTLRNRINDLETEMQYEEEQERWYEEQESEATKRRQADIDTYNDYLESTAADNILSDEAQSYLDGLYADEIAEAEEEAREQDEAWEEYLAEKGREETNKKNNDGTERQGTDAEGEGMDNESEPEAANDRDGGSQATVPTEEPHQSEAEAQHYAEQAGGGRGTHTPTGNSDADRSIPVQAQKLNEIKVRASHFPTETSEESGAFGRLVPKMTDEELLAYMRLDGNGDPNKAYHPELYDEYDYRHGDEEQGAYDSCLQQLKESGTTKEQAEDMLTNVHSDYAINGSTDERSILNGQQSALIDYIQELQRRENLEQDSYDSSHSEEKAAAVQRPTEPIEDSGHSDNSSHSKDSLGATSALEEVEAERQGVNTEPTEKQKEAGNYKKGHIKVDGYDITIENPKGSSRSGKDASGKAWSVPMHYDYGYIKGTEGVDGDHIDVYLSDNPTSGNVYVVDQIDQNTGKFDEHKVMYGFPSKEAAVEAYKGQYEKGWKVGPVTEVSREDFKKWVESSKRKTKPFSEYKSVKDAAALRHGPHGKNGDDVRNMTDDELFGDFSRQPTYEEQYKNKREEIERMKERHGIQSANAYLINEEFSTEKLLKKAKKNYEKAPTKDRREQVEALENRLKAIRVLMEEFHKEWDEELAKKRAAAQQRPAPSKPTVKLTRKGDFYEAYGDDADIAGQVLGITVTKRNGVSSNLASFPLHALDTYLPKLIKAGYPIDIRVGGKVVEHITPMSGGEQSMEHEANGDNSEAKKLESGKDVLDEAERRRGLSNREEIKPVGTGDFGPIYDQFQGKPNEAFAFLKEHKNGYLKGVFHRDDIGDIDLAWGTAPTNYTGKGLAHIIRKHVEVLGDFSSAKDAFDTISDVIVNGEAYDGGNNTWNIEKGNFRVVIARDKNGNWVLSAFDFKTPKKKKKGSVTPLTPNQTAYADGAGAVAPNLSSDGKDSKKNNTKQEKGEKKVVSSQPEQLSLFDDEEPATGKPYYPIGNGRRQSAKGIDFPVGWGLPTKNGRNIKVTKVLPDENRREVSWTDGEGKEHSEEMSTEELRHLTDVAFGFADDDTNNNNYGKDDTENAGETEAGGGADRPLGPVRPSGNGVLGSSELGRADTGEVGGNTAAGSRLADGQPGGLSAVGSRGGAAVDADSGDKTPSLGSGRRHGVSAGVRPLGEGHTDRGADGRPGASERPLRVPVRPGADASGSDSGESPERGASSEEGTGVRGLLAGQGKPGKPARDEATATTRADDGSKKTASERDTPLNTRNYLYPKDGADIDNMSVKDRLVTNVDALETLAQLVHEGRTANADERNTLGKFRGWGGVDMIDVWNVDSLMSKARKWDSSRREDITDKNNPYYRLGMVIKSLDPDGKRGVFDSIKQAALTSYYTPLPIAKAMNEYLSLAGYKGGGSMLDPSIGNGVFEGTMPKDMQQRTQIYGVELDWLTAQIAKNLYPDAHIQQSGYQEAGLGKGAFDIVESNIPFGSIKVYDPSWRHDSSPAKKAAQGKIHTYFALKMMENAKPGGLVTIMTSNSIMDTPGNGIIREALLEQGEFLGAVRLPDNTFKGAGTRVVTDVIFMRKYKDENDRVSTLAREGYAEKQQQFSSVDTIKAHNDSDGKDYDVRISSYYKANPKMMFGKVVAGGQYRGDEFGLTSEDDTNTLAKKMRAAIKKDVVGDRAGQLYDTHKTERKIYQAIREVYVGDGSYQSSGNIVEQNGKFGVLHSVSHDDVDMGFDFEENPKLARFAARIRLYIPVRTALKKLIAAQINREPEKAIEGYRKELNAAYNAFRSRYGLLNDKANNFIAEDIDSYQMLSLEDIDEDTKKLKGLADIFTKNTIKPTIDTSKVNDPTSAIATSLAQYGEVRPSFMEKVLGKDWPKLCGDTLYKVPFSESYVVSDDYLSGDVKSKLENAKRAAEENPEYKRNVEALEKVQPRDIPVGEINIRMGARWVPDNVYTDFMKQMFGIPNWDHVKSGVRYIPESDDYIVNVDSGETGMDADKWATDRRSAKDIFEAAMKDRSLKVFDHHADGSTSINKAATELANSKVQDLREAFETWVTSDPERADELGRMYNEKFNRTVIRQWSAPFLQPVGLQGKTLRPHQQAAVWMLLNNRGGIVDHIVGAGKTLVMQSAIMEMRRMGIAKKPMIIALKATVGQIAKEFAQAYPTAKILAPTEKDFEKKNRKKLFAKIATNDYDCVIVSHDNYVKFAHTKEIESQTLREQLQQLEAAIMLMRTNDVNGRQSQLTKRQLKGLEKRKANLEARMKRIMDRPTDKEFCFENLGVDYLFVDECQRFKSLPYATTYNQVAGLGDPIGSTKAVALLNGVRYLQQLHQGDRGTVFLSGTTITNSLVEVYNLLNYLRPNMMKKLGYTTFDAWAAQFAVRSSELEYGVTNELKEKNRFRYFQNVSELGKMYAEIADVRNDYNLKLPKPKPRTHLVTIEPSKDLEIINEQIVNMVKTKDGSYFGIVGNDKTPWSLNASSLSTKASVSPRLVDPNLPDDPHGKIATACENVAKIYKQFDAQKGTQLIFCDTGVPSKGKEYDAYTDIINRLVNDYGIPRKEIVDIHTANTDDKRKALFKKVRDGQVRILIGGTVNMGTGVNVQPRLVALHHIDIPWQPADTEQRNGRGVRQGNIIARDFNDNNVDIYYYAVKGTLDTYRYQLQDIKGKMFAQFKLNTIDSDSAREFDEGEIDADGQIDPAQMVAMLSGNPVIFEKSKQDKLVKKLRRQESSEYNDYLRRKRNIESLKSRKESFEAYQRMNDRDKHYLERNGYDPSKPGNEYKIVDGEGKVYPWKKATEAGKIIHKLWKSAKPFTLEGYGMKAHVVQTGDDIFGFQISLKPVDNHWGLSELPYSVPLSGTDQAAGQAFANLVKAIYHSGEAYKSELDTLNHKLEGSDKIGEFQFSKQKQLEEAVAKKKELDEEYQKLSDEANDDASKEEGEPQGNQDSGDDGALYRIADEVEAAKLDKEPTVKVYRAMQLIDGKLYPPMMAAVKGKLVEPRELGQWEVADERPGIIESIKKNKAGEEIGYVTLDKGSKDATGKKGTPIKGVAYNPYWHTSRSPLNDQFKSAWIRPNIVTVEVEVPVSELTSGYRAKYAKDPVGETDWHSGSVTKQLTAQGHTPRKVILSRYDKPVRVLSAAETAERIIDYIGDYDVTIPENVVTPQVRVELEKRGIKIGAPEKGVKKTEQIREAIERGLSVSDDMLRDSEVFEDGERLPVEIRNGQFGVGGLNNEYRDPMALLNAFRDKYPQYVASFVDSKGEPVEADGLVVRKYDNPGGNDTKMHWVVQHGLSIQVEPWRKYLKLQNEKGAAHSSVEHDAYLARKTRNAMAAVKHWADKMHLDDKVTVLTSTDGLQGKKAQAKGWFVPKDGKITVVLPNHTDVGDVIRTLLHEGVAHYGLRQLFGEYFDNFLDNVYNNASNDVKSHISKLEDKYDGDKRKATEEYLAGLAEDTDFEHTVNSSWWSKIKNFFLDMLAKAGLKLKHQLTDNDLRYVLWRSYENMKHPGEKRNPADGHLNDAIAEIEGDKEPREAAAQPRQTEQRGIVAADMNRRGMATREHNEQEKADMRNAAEDLGETLGGVPVTIERNGRDGIKGSYNTEDNTVHVNLDEADGIEDVEATVAHEVLGHEGLKALFDSNKGVDKFGQFIYDSASKELRRKIVEKAEEEGYDWDDPLRFSKAAQEVFSDIASDGPANADEFSLWRKVKHYVIRALKALGIRIRGIVNDHDLRYYVLKTGTAVKKWRTMDEEAQREAAEPGRVMYSRRGKPRKRKDETMAQYIERLRHYEQWKQAEEKAKSANDPLPEAEDYNQKAQDEYNKAMDDWRKANNIQPGDKEPSEFPKRKDGETPQDYAIRVADYETQSDIWKNAPNVFDYIKKAQDEYRAAYEAWKTRYDIHEMESVDEKLYSGEPISDTQPQTDEQHYDHLEVEHAVERDAERELGNAVGMDLSADGARHHAKLAVIERRKNLESSSAEDAIFIHDLCKDIDALAKKKGMKPAELREKLIDVIESPVAQRDAEKEIDKWVDVLNNMRAFQDAHSSITADGVKAALPELNALSHLYVKYGVKPSTYERRKEIHDAAKVLADKFNDYYKDTTGYNQLFGDDIMQVGKYIVKMSDAAYAAAAASKLAEDPDVKAIVDRIHDWYDNFFHVIEDAGLRGDAGYVENGYINHIWDKEKSDPSAWEKYVENFQRTKSANMRHRTISTYADGIEVGLVPKFNDVAQIMSYYSRQNNEAIANKKFLDDLSFLTISELNKDGEVVRALPVLNSHHPSRFDEECYQMYHVPGVGDVWVLKDVSRRFSSIFGTMRTQDIPDWLSKTGKVYDLLGSTMKKIQLSISGFHALALTEVAIAQMGPINGVRWAAKSLPIELKPLLMLKELFKGTLIDSIKNGTIPAYARPEDFKFAASHLVQLGATQDYAAADVNMITEKFRNYVKGLREDEAFIKQAAGTTLTPLAVMLDFINKGMDKLLWNYLHDGLKIACFKWIAEKVDKMVEKKGLTSEQRERLLDEAGQYVNDTFGGQYWELLNVSPAALKWMRRALLSPDWFISTQRHFFANFGFGSLYDTRSFGEYVKESLRLKRAAAVQRLIEQNSSSSDKGEAQDEATAQQPPTEPSEAVDDNGDIYRILRSTLARLCYVVGVGVFYTSLMNGLNSVMRVRDKEKEKEKADEIRKTNPDYKSPYELAYPDGMKWYDYTMFGNSLGQQTHLFLGRYADGSEMYVRWGKQFREFPEMFIGRKGLDFPAPMIQRMMGKANPVIGLVRDNLGALDIWGFENSSDIEEIQTKYGKQIGLLAMNARHFLPFSLPTQSEKEFKMIDLFMPSQKGFTRYKTVDFFKDFIKAGDMEGVARTYRAATMNGIDVEKCLQAAITTLKAEQRDELSDGIKDLSQAVKRYDEAKTLKEKKVLKNKLTKYLAAEGYKAFTRDEAMQMIEDYMNGDNVAEKDNDRYIELSNSGDIREDYRLSAIGKQAKKFVRQIKTAQSNGDAATAKKLGERYHSWMEINTIINRERSAVNKLKKQLGKGNDKAVMSKIREVRKHAQQLVDAVPAPK